MNIYRQAIRDATDEELSALVRFFDRCELRKYYSGLLEDCRCERQLREIAKEDADATR